MKTDKLKTILDNHGKWWRGDGGERANLTGAYLSGAYLSGVNLTGATMSTDDHLDNSRWQDFLETHAQYFNQVVLDTMIKDIQDIDRGMAKHVRPILKPTRKEK